MQLRVRISQNKGVFIIVFAGVFLLRFLPLYSFYDTGSQKENQLLQLLQEDMDDNCLLCFENVKRLISN